LNEEKDKKNSLATAHTKLVDKERLYFKITREFLDECKKNEVLQSKLDD